VLVNAALGIMIEFETKVPVKSGTWLYAGTIPCEIRIVRHHVLYGSADYEDPPEIAEDREVECFYILYATPAGSPKWVGGGAELTLQNAMARIEAKLPAPVTWCD
jgi:hypothetical protein